MTDPNKDEILAMAREAGCAWLHEPLAQRFAALCRADLVAEVERLKKMSVANIMVRIVPGYDGGGEEIYAKSVEEVNAVMSDLSQRLDDVETDRDDWKARALKAEQAGEPTTEQLTVLFTKESGGPNPYYRCRNCGKTEPGLQEYLAAHWKTCAPPRPAAQEPTSAVPVVEQLVGALSCNRIMAADSDGNYTKEVTPRIITAAIAAGQKFIKENGAWSDAVLNLRDAIAAGQQYLKENGK